MRLDKIKAIDLRKQKKTYREISQILGIPKSTLSSWFKRIPWSRKLKDRLSYKNSISQKDRLAYYSRLRAEEAQRRRNLILEKARKEIKNLSLEDLKLIGAALYWAEGRKNNKWCLLFVNSDPAMITLMMKFFREVCRIPEGKLSMKIQIHPNISENRAKKFWAEIVGIASKKFTKTLYQVSRASKGKRNKKSLPYGTCRITISDTRLTNQVYGWIQGLAGQKKL